VPHGKSKKGDAGITGSPLLFDLVQATFREWEAEGFEPPLAHRRAGEA